MAEVPSQYSDISDSLNNDESIVLGWKKYDRLLQSHLDRYTFEDDKSKNIIALAKAMWSIKDFQSYINHLIQLNNANLDNTIWAVEISEKFMDDLTQLAQIKNNLSGLKWDIEKQKNVPFEILGWQILVQNTEWEWWIKFAKWDKQWKQIWNDEIMYNESTNRYVINVDYKWFPKNLEIEYNGWHVIKIHDTRYNRVERVKIISKNIDVQDIKSYWYNWARIESYQTPREIDIPFRWQRIKLQILFNK